MRLRPMILPLAWLLVASPASAQVPAELPDYVFAVSPEEENLDILAFGEAKPTLIRFRVRINGRGYRSHWDGFLARLYAFADLNNDGVLSEAEAARPGWRQLLTAPSGGFNQSSTIVLPVTEAVPEAKDGKVSVTAFVRHVRDTLKVDPLTVQPFQSGEAIHQATFNELDRDRDGVLSATELAGAEALMARLDLDEDDVLDTLELQPNRSPFEGIFFVSDSTLRGDPNAGPFLPLSGEAARLKGSQRLLARYDAPPHDGRLDRAELGLDPEAFRRADRNQDGGLDLVEVQDWLVDPTPTHVYDVRVAKAPGQPPTIDDPTAPVGTPGSGLTTLSVDGRDLLLNGYDAERDFTSFFNRRFDLAAQDKDGMLDRGEAGRARFFADFFDTADRDADGKLTRPELAQYLERSTDLSQSRTTLTLTDEGRRFFNLLDANGDGRVGRRELRTLASRSKAADRDGDGRIRFDEPTSQFRISIGRGVNFPNQGNNRANDTYDTPEPPRPGGEKPGLAWFHKMDRNRDGDLSPREFLGPPDLFRKLDRDGDGLIDPAEAAKGP